MKRLACVFLVFCCGLASASLPRNSPERLNYTGLVNRWGHVLDGCGHTEDPLGLRTNVTRNLGLTTNSLAAGYDSIGQLVSWSAKETGGALRQNEQFGFGYDRAHNLSSRTNGALIQTFGADAVNQLTNVARSGALTVSGVTTVPAASVTVNGQAAQTYADFTFASTNNALTNGQNSFAVVARNASGLAATNIVSVNLPLSVALLYDANGNLTNDGTRSFAYDAEDRLATNWVAGAWKSEFVYDGLGRRRIERDYSWGGGAWQLTNETHCIYDGWLVIQERNGANAVQVTYTRGLDLSGTLQYAGGIGGLLARTDGNGSTFYHSDGAGNIAGLIDASENMAARYLYGPFGRLTAQWGPLASANAMQFSSMPRHANSGLSLYPFRAYDPSFQRFLNHDPIGENGGINLYGFVGNNPLGVIDPLGLDWLWMSTDGKVHTTMPPSEQPAADPNSFGALHGFGDLTGGQRMEDFFGDFLKESGKQAVENGLLAAAMAGGLGEEEAGAEADGGLLKWLKGLGKKTKCPKNPIRLHHPWPKYLGGNPEQILEPLPKALHDAYHAGRDEILGRWRGTDYYSSLPPDAQAQVLQALKNYTQDFDAKYGMQLYDAMAREGFPQ